METDPYPLGSPKAKHFTHPKPLGLTLCRWHLFSSFSPRRCPLCVRLLKVLAGAARCALPTMSQAGWEWSAGGVPFLFWFDLSRTPRREDRCGVYKQPLRGDSGCPKKVLVVAFCSCFFRAWFSNIQDVLKSFLSDPPIDPGNFRLHGSKQIGNKSRAIIAKDSHMV